MGNEDLATSAFEDSHRVELAGDGYAVGIHGGSMAGIAAALELSRHGVRVWLSTHRNYLGEDLCDPLRLCLPQDMDTQDTDLQLLFPAEVRAAGYFRPMALKRRLDQMLADAGIPVALGSVPGEVFVDEAGAVQGVSLCDRCGRRLMPCKLLVDATVQGDLLRLAAVPLTPPLAMVPVIRRVIGGESAADASAWRVQAKIELDGASQFLWEYAAEHRLAGAGWGDWMELEQQVRLRAFRRGQSYSADGIEAFSGEHLHVYGSAAQDSALDFTAEQIALSSVTALQESLWVLGAAAQLTPTRRLSLLRADSAWLWGKALAVRMAQQLRSVRRGGEWHSRSRVALPQTVQARDLALSPGLLPASADMVHAIERVDVLVVGGGTGGAPAAIAAARSGARTLVAEFLSGLGGVGTLGLIGKYWFGIREGFTAEVDSGVGQLSHGTFAEGSWDVEAKMQWYHREITAAGGRIWYKTAISGALCEGKRVVGAILCTPRGRVAVLARCSVDATGSAELAAAAGARTVCIGDGHLALQGTGLPARDPGRNYTNTDYDFIDDSDTRDTATAHVAARVKFSSAFDAGQLVDSRERRRIVGDMEITPMDIRLGRVFPDTICRARSNFDTHGFTVHPLYLLVTPGHEPVSAHIPLRALLPAGLDGIIVTGLGISAHRDAMPVIRMQADVQNQGYAAGMIAAFATDGEVRALDCAAIQQQLVDCGILTPELLLADDSFPLPADEIERALADSVHNPNLLDRVFTLSAGQSRERLRHAFEQADDCVARRHFAFALGVLGDPSGVAILAEEVAATPWDDGWDYRGMGQFGASMSPLDARIIALGRCRQLSSLPVLMEKARSLPADAAFSHYRAIAEACASIGDAAAAPVLEALLQRDGIRGHALTHQQSRIATASEDSNETRFRNRALIEISLATAWFTLDPNAALARSILQTYAHDVRALFAKHARKLLA